MQERPSDANPASAWHWGDYALDPARRLLTHHGEPVEIEDRVFDLLALLLQHRERALDRREVTEAIWGKRPVSDATLRQLVYAARRAVGDDGDHQHTISTLYGRGLQWVAPVEMVFGVADAPASAPAGSAGLPAPVGADGAGGAEPERASPGARWSAARSPRWLLGAVLVVLAAVSIVFAAGIERGWWMRPAAIAAAASGGANVPQPAAGPMTIAVLPFRSTEVKQEYLSDGLTEELITRLGRFPDLRVAARTSSFVFRGKPVDIREAARQLGVANVLEGSVEQSGDRLHVRVALVNASDGYERWSAEYDPATGDVLKVEDEIATAVLKELQPKLEADAVAASHATDARAAVDPAAHHFYLLGLQYLNRRTVPDIQQALGDFKLAILIEPHYASAWSGMASAYNLLREHNSDTAPDTYYAEGLSAAREAAALDPHLARAHLALALLHEAHWEWAPAEHEFGLALQLDPSDADAHQRYGVFQWYMRDPAKALAQMRLARDLDPLSPIINTDLARSLLFNRQFDAAIAQFQATLKLDPGFALCHLLLAQAYMAKNRNAEAVTEAKTALALVPSPPPSSYLSVYGVALFFNGDKAGAKEQLQILEARSRQHYVSGASLALLQAQVGSEDAMYANLARAERDHDALMRPAVASRNAPWYGDPRFNALLVKMGLPTKY